jgi:hypothetical protein
MAPFNTQHDNDWHVGARLLPAIILITVGALFLLNNLHIFYIHDIVRYWPVILIALGLVKLVDSAEAGGRVAGGILVAVGGLFLAQTLGYFVVRMRDLWPLILIGVGLLLLFQRTMWAGPSGASRRGFKTSGNLRECAVFSGGKRNISSQEFTGGHIDAVFGGFEIDLRSASIAGESAVLDINAIFGGAEIKVPESWEVVLRGVGVFGAFTDETHHPPQGPGAKQLIAKGAAIFGGVVFKN